MKRTTQFLLDNKLIWNKYAPSLKIVWFKFSFAVCPICAEIVSKFCKDTHVTTYEDTEFSTCGNSYQCIKCHIEFSLK